MATEAPYIGYRSAGRRPERNNDRRASADAPLAALRGMVSGVLGAPGDIESLIRMLPGLREETVLPTSEDVAKRLPLREVSETPIGRAATFGGQIVGGTYTGPGSPLRAIAALPSAVKRAAGDFAMAAGQPAVNVVKQKGGNWLAGSIDDALKPLKQGRHGFTEPYTQAQLDELAARLDEARSRPGFSPHLLQMGEQELAEMTPKVALNRWIDKKLGRYIQNEMATPEDPVRALAERGVLHVDPADLYHGNRPVHPSGEVMEKLGQSGAARAWENASDYMVSPTWAEDLTARFSHFDEAAQKWIDPDTGEVLAEQWAKKLPIGSKIYDVRNTAAPELGFSHIIDELRNATNPESDLPRELLLKYSDLDKVTVPQAVERVAKINEWRAAQKVLADAARANNAATQVFKEYPDKGYKWVELKAGDLPEGYTQKTHEIYGEHVYGPRGEPIKPFGMDDPRYKALQDALKYEGETMGHCVGGYCPDVLEGRSRIYSLRDAKGQPHVTVEVKPPEGFAGMKTEEDFIKLASESQPPEVVQDMLASAREHNAFTPKIMQIKGKANRAPKEDYLPFVQDFVRSGKWSDVGDLGNTGLVEFTKRRQTIPKSVQGVIPRFDEMGIEGGYFTEDELTGIIKDWQTKSGKTGFAQGGAVSIRDLYAKYATGGAVQSAPRLSGETQEQADARYAAMRDEYARMQVAREQTRAGTVLEGTYKAPQSSWDYVNAVNAGESPVVPAYAVGTIDQARVNAISDQPASGGGGAPSYGGGAGSGAYNPNDQGVGGGQYNPNGPGQIVTTPGQPGTYTPPGMPTANTPQEQVNTDGLGGLSGQMPYRPPSVYAPMPVWKSEGSFFPINYNPARIQDIVSHLQSQMYV